MYIPRPLSYLLKIRILYIKEFEEILGIEGLGRMVGMFEVSNALSAIGRTVDQNNEKMVLTRRERIVAEAAYF